MAETASRWQTKPRSDSSPDQQNKSHLLVDSRRDQSGLVLLRSSSAQHQRRRCPQLTVSSAYDAHMCVCVCVRPCLFFPFSGKPGKRRSWGPGLWPRRPVVWGKGRQSSTSGWEPGCSASSCIYSPSPLTSTPDLRRTSAEWWGTSGKQTSTIHHKEVVERTQSSH